MRRRSHGEIIELIFELDHKTLGELLANTGNACKLRMVLRADGLHRVFRRQPAQHFDGELWADAAHRDEPLEEPLFVALHKSEESDLVVAHPGMNMQRGFGAQR